MERPFRHAFDWRIGLGSQVFLPLERCTSKVRYATSFPGEKRRDTLLENILLELSTVILHRTQT